MSAARASDDVLGKALDRTLLRRIFAFVWPHGRLLGMALALLPIGIGLELAQPALLRRAIDHHVAVGRMQGLGTLALIYLGTLLGQYVAVFLQLYFTQAVGQRAMNDLRLRLHQHVLSLSTAFFDRTPLGRLMTRLTSDVESLSEMFAAGLVSLVGDLLKLVFIVIAMVSLAPRLAVFSLLVAPVLFLVAALFRRLVRDAFRDVRTRLARLNGFLHEHLQGVTVVKAFTREPLVEARFETLNHAYREANGRAIRADAALFAIVEAIGSIAVAALIWRGGGDIVRGTLTFGTLVAFVEYLGKFFAPIRDLSTKYTVMQQAMAGAERVFELLDTREPDAAPDLPVVAPTAPAAEAGSSSPASTAAAVSFHGVDFFYKADAPVLRGLSLSVAQGEAVALVGTSGAGKSTLVKLLVRFYEPTRGCVRLAGHDVRSLDKRALRRRVVLVGQDPHLFAGTVAENIGLGEAPAERVRAAAERVGLLALLSARPDGLNTRVAPRGANLSGGERQLVAFARALSRDPEVLVLDEATASVDPETERLIDGATSELMRGRTTIVIAHRLSTVARCSRVVVLDGGRVAEEGSHGELIARAGIYARLERLQRLDAPPTERALQPAG